MNTSRTIAFLRTLTLDGYLTSDEVWALARFLNENPACAESWPGGILVPMLQNVFEDAHLTEDEMRLLAEAISNIEEEWIGRAPDPELPEEAPEPSASPHPALLPVIDQKIEVPAIREDASYVVALREHSCTCPDWSVRKQHPERHPSRCCRHIAYAFARSGKVFEPWFQALLDDCFAYARGTPSNCQWMLLDLQPKKPVLLAGGSGDWCMVFAPGKEGYESFAFSPVQRRWSFGEAPAHSRAIEHAIRATFPGETAPSARP